MKFEMYEPKRLLPHDQPLASLARGDLRFNVKASDLYLEKVRFVQLGYNEKSGKILVVLKKGAVSTMGLLKVTYGKSGGMISARGFRNHFNVDTKEIVRYSIEIEDEGIVLTRLSKDAPIGRVENHKPLGRNKKKTTAPIKPKKTMGEPETPKKQAPKTDYACIDCGETNVAWKYKESFKPDGHPKVCPKCHCPDFEEVKE